MSGPLVYTERIWRTLYHRQVNGEAITYGAKWREGLSDNLRDGRVESISKHIDDGASVLVVGCAYGWLIERLLAHGYEAWGVDSSPYVHDNIDESNVAERIANATVGRDDVHQVLESSGFPTRYDCVVDEDATPGHWGEDVDSFNLALESLGDVVIHFTSPLRDDGRLGDSALNWMSMADWERTAPGHVWLNARGGS